MENNSKLTRRQMLQLTGVGMLGAGAMIAGTGCSSSTTASSSAAASETVKLSVYDPSGNVEITETHAPRLDTLEGKTIAFVGDDMWEEDRTFELIEKLMKEKYPTVTIITQENFAHGNDAITKDNNGLPEQMKEKNVDGVIVGNAG